MKKILGIFLMLVSIFGYAQLENISGGELLNFRIHYGALNAGTATLAITRTNFQGAPHLYVKGTGRTTGAVRTFFRVEDLYESFINIQTGLPSFYVRNVREGGYTQHYQTVFNQPAQSLILTDKKNPANGSRVIKTVKGLQDMLSCFYYLRAKSADELRPGAIINMNVWIDDNIFPFRLRVVGKEVRNTKFGHVECLKIIPSVLSGRVFKDKEGVTMWVTNDANHVPITLKAELAVGSLQADLDSYKNVKYPIAFY